MSWNLEGQRVSGKYMGEFSYTGLVLNSRVKFGGKVQHTVLVDEPLHIFENVEPKEMILVEEEEINQVMEIDNVYC